jgi:hypothetical protein
VEGHPAFPYRKNFEGIVQIKRKVIKQHIPQAPTEKDAKSGIDDKIGSLLRWK